MNALLPLAPELAEPDPVRPRTRGDCKDGPRPCPFVSCAHHLALDVRGDRVIEAFPGREIDDLPETCALDVADRGGVTLEVVGAALNVTRERIRQIEAKALRKVARLLDLDEPKPRRRLEVSRDA